MKQTSTRDQTNIRTQHRACDTHKCWCTCAHNNKLQTKPDSTQCCIVHSTASLQASQMHMRTSTLVFFIAIALKKMKKQKASTLQVVLLRCQLKCNKLLQLSEHTAPCLAQMFVFAISGTKTPEICALDLLNFVHIQRFKLSLMSGGLTYAILS